MRPSSPVILALALCLGASSPVLAQDTETAVERPAPEAIAEMFAETESALGQGRKTVAADLLMEIIEDPQRRDFQ